MKLKTKWKISISLISIVSLFILGINFINFNSLKQKQPNMELQLSIEDTVAIPYGDYVYEQQHASQSLDWRFESSKDHIGIRVLLMDSDDFYGFQHGLGWGAFILSGGEHHQDAGRYDIPHEDDWVVVFQNNDLDQELVIVSYELIFDGIDPLSIVSTVMAFSIVVGVISIVIYIVRKKDRDLEVQNSRINSELIL